MRWLNVWMLEKQKDHSLVVNSGLFFSFLVISRLATRDRLRLELDLDINVKNRDVRLTQFRKRQFSWTNWVWCRQSAGVSVSGCNLEENIHIMGEETFHLLSRDVCSLSAVNFSQASLLFYLDNNHLDFPWTDLQIDLSSFTPTWIRHFILTMFMSLNLCSAFSETWHLILFTCCVVFHSLFCLFNTWEQIQTFKIWKIKTIKTVFFLCFYRTDVNQFSSIQMKIN